MITDMFTRAQLSKAIMPSPSTNSPREPLLDGTKDPNRLECDSDISSLSGAGVRLRKGENSLQQTFLAWYSFGVQIVFMSVFVLLMIHFVDGATVNANNIRYSDTKTFLLASDATTAVSVALVLSRVVTGS